VPTAHQDESRIHNGGDAEIVKNDQEVIVTASIFEMRQCPEKRSLTGGHSLGSVVKVSTLEMVEAVALSNSASGGSSVT
jgi:hypothetical protein